MFTIKCKGFGVYACILVRPQTPPASRNILNGLKRRLPLSSWREMLLGQIPDGSPPIDWRVVVISMSRGPDLRKEVKRTAKIAIKKPKKSEADAGKPETGRLPPKADPLSSGRKEGSSEKERPGQASAFSWRIVSSQPKKEQPFVPRAPRRFCSGSVGRSPFTT